MSTGSPRRPVLVVQHLAPEGPALIGTALAARGCTFEVVRVDTGAALPPDLAGHAGLVVMGGPMSASSDDGFPTRLAEVALIADALERGIPMLGVCLGAQLLAVAAGAAIRSGGVPEIGWGTVQVPGGADDPLFEGVGPDLSVLHWHGETFDLPDGAVHLASSAAYPNQAFRMGPSAWGLQFHLEVDEAAVKRFVDSFGDEADDPEAIAREARSQLSVSADDRTLILDRFARLIG
jgi:GMP synthase-like glutamine amidotransferase